MPHGGTECARSRSAPIVARLGTEYWVSEATGLNSPYTWKYVTWKNTVTLLIDYHPKELLP